MADKTITARRATYAGKIGTVQFTAGSATVDDSTAAGKAAIAFAIRHGWAVSGGTASATSPSVAQGKPVADWTEGEIDTYLAAQNVMYPSNAALEDKRNLVTAAFETKAQGGAANPDGTAGHDSGTIPPEGAPPVSAPSKPDDATETIHYHTPITGVAADVAPAITVQPAATSKTEGATATYTVTATGTPTPTYQWQRQTKGAGAYADISGATSASYTTPALTVADNHNDRYRVVVTNSDSSVTSNSVQQAVTAP